MPSAADEYVYNIDFFATLSRQTGTVKLEYNATTGRFSVASAAFFRSIGNWGKGDAKQSITNNSMFHDPIVAVFRAAATHDANEVKRLNAFHGIQSLRKHYSDAEKLRYLTATLNDIKPFIPESAGEKLMAHFRRIDPATVLTPLDLTFMDKIWDFRATLFAFLEEGQKPDPANNPEVRPYAQLASAIYRQYGGHLEPRITNLEEWIKSIPTISHKGAPHYPLQNKGYFPASKYMKLITSRYYGADFIYYSVNQGVDREEIWRIYLNFAPENAGVLLRFLGEQAATYHIHSFKIAGPLAFHTRTDKVVVYVSHSGLDGLTTTLIRDAATFGFCNPVPAMTIQLAPGISKGVEPGSVNLGFSVMYDRDGNLDLSPRQLRRQSYGTIRSQLIAAALTQMYAVEHDSALARGAYLGDKQNFLKWVAIAFESYRDELEGRTR